MVLLIDIGNSNICFAIHQQDQLISSYRIKSFLEKSADEYYLLFKPFIESPLDDVIISSVVPQISSAIFKMCEKYYHITPKVIGPKIKSGIKIIADDPKSVGADLICDVVGASSYFNEGIIIDLGTASKFLYYKDHAFMSCAIAPGIATSMKAMINKAALLPNMELVLPKKILNNSTIPCMQAGVLYGFASMVDGMIKKIKKELNNPNLKVIATGGLISLIAPICEEKIDIIDENLVLNGLFKIYLKNI